MNNLLHWQAPAVKKLLGWRQTEDEEKWAEKAVDALVKKLKKKNNGYGTVEDLEFALANPSSPSKCVTIKKSQDGRLQVSHRKGLPHVIYCQVWRWPDLTSHQELRHLPECRFPYDNSGKSELICINPYHYQRIDTPRVMMNCYGNSNSPQMSIPSPTTSGNSVTSPPPLIGTSNCSTPEYTAASPSVFSEDGDTQPLMVPSPLSRLLPSPNFWATISYYELNSRVGGLFKVWKREVTVDGFTDPTNAEDRICLGQISNVNRNGVIENTRKHIGRGILLEYNQQNNLQISNMSSVPVFIQSRILNCCHNRPSPTVCRLPPGNTLCVFDHARFYQMLERAKMGYVEELFQLQKMCSIRLSFVKGWGPDYPRQDVTSTPCWVDIQLHVPLAWIDQALPQSRPGPGGGSQS